MLRNRNQEMAGIRGCPKEVFLSVLLTSAMWMGAHCAAGAQETYEAPPVFKASELLPKDLLRGPNHSVDDRVVNDGYMNHYTIQSRFGTFKADSDAELRIRVHEIRAIAAMDKVRGTEEFGKSMKEAGANMLRTAKDVVANPAETLSGAVSGVGKMFERAGENLFGSSAKSETEDSRWKQAIGFSKTKREYAAQYGVDVYSSNEVLQQYLDDIAWAGYAGGLSVGIALMPVGGAAGTALTALGGTKISNDALKTTAPADLRIRNQKKLEAMGVDASVIELFMSNAVFSLTHQTLLVDALSEMKGVADRGRFVHLAVLTDKEDVAFFRQRQAQMYAGYHKSIAPIERFVPVGQLAAAHTRNGAVVFAVPLDHLAWTKNMARTIDGAHQVVAGKQGVKEKQLWLGGTVSPTARKAIETRGWKVHEKTAGKLIRPG